MCAGQSSRYPKPYPKHLETIFGEPNYKRTIRLLNDNGINDVVISVSDQNEHYFDYSNKIIGSDKREIDRFRNLRNYFDDEALILYGDVIYHENDMKILLNNLNKEIQFFGGLDFIYQEIFGVYVSNKTKFFRAVDNVTLKFDNHLIKREIGLDVFEELEMNRYDLIILPDTNDYDVIEEYYKKIVEYCRFVN
jgi:hypothetical protein